MKRLSKFVCLTAVLACLSSGVVRAQDDILLEEEAAAVQELIIQEDEAQVSPEENAQIDDESIFLEEEVIEELPPSMMDMPVIKLRWLNKITARNKTIEVKVGETVEIGGLYMKPRACRKASPLEKPESAAFLQIWENGVDGKSPEWVFSGWMFASSPGLSSMDHPIYDVWVLECLGDVDEALSAPDVITQTPEEDVPENTTDTTEENKDE